MRFYFSATKTAKGVVFWRNRQQFIVKAKKEVILCAGSFESPKLLMLSGIGPASHLQNMNIDVLKDLPVGQNMYDHVAVLGPIFTIRNIDRLNNLENLLSPKVLAQYAVGFGPLTTNAWESFMFIKTPLSNSTDPNFPDIEIVQSFTSLSFDTSPSTKLAQRLSDNTYKEVLRVLKNKRAFHMVNVLLHPRSKSYMRLRSNDSLEYPQFYPNYLHDDHDVETLVAGIKQSIQIAKENPFLEIDAQLIQLKVPGCQTLKFNTHDYWRCYAMHLTSGMAHQVIQK
jgi:choline dehydrogenase-like flavoprotein